MVLTGSGTGNALGGLLGADEGRTAQVWVAGRGGKTAR